MCGILGVWDIENSIDKNLLIKMRDTLIHRGPDDKGIYIDNNIGLAHRRLSIIDLSKAGNQPMSNEDESIWITYNGEIYNFKEIREELEKKGHRFKSNTDTEVIIHAYEEYGINCLSLFNGMFAFGIWDSNKKQLFLARDRLGIKQLYYYFKDKQFIFASEMKAILKADISKIINKNVLRDYFSYLYIPAPSTIFKNIYKLKPGHYLILNKDGLKQKQYWDINYTEKRISKKNAEKLIIKNLKESIKKRLISDVPLGAFLSGGIDSSTVVALMSNITDNVKTFSIGFEGSENDELELARKTAKMYNTDHNEYIIKPAEFNLFPKLVYYADEPFADSSLIPTYMVSQIARKKVTVCLSGDGGDENFAGYNRYLKNNLEKAYSLIPIYNERFKRIKQIAKIKNPLLRFIKGNEKFIDSEKRKLLNFKFENSFKLKYLKKFSRLNSLLYLDLKTTLADDYLKKVDTASMANSLEVRVPFLDHNFMEFVATLPPNYKLHYFNKKYILKKAVKKLIPKQVIVGKKRGFSIPINDWLKKDLKDELKELAFSSIKRGYLNKEYINKIWNQHQKGIFDHRDRLWGLISLEIWNKIYMDNIQPEKIIK